MDPLLLRATWVVLVVLLSALAGRVWQRRDGRIAVAAVRSGRDHRAGLGLATDHDGPQAVLFGSSTCAPCDTVKGLLRDVAADDDRFRWHYVDAADHLDVADAHDVRRVPTLLVVDEHGEIVARSSGVPRRDELAAAVGGRATA